MTHFVVLIVIPRNIFLQGDAAIYNYIDNIMKPYHEDVEVDPYIIITKDDLKKEFDTFTENGKNEENGYLSVEEYCKEWHEYDMDEHGNALSTYNKDSLFDWYEIGGRWDGVLTNNEQYSENDTITNNSINIKDFLENYEKDMEKNTYYGIIDKEGKLYKGRDYGWFGTYHDTCQKNKRKNEYEKILNNVIDDYLISLDCHI